MGQISVKAEAVLEAPSEEVYATIADYRQGHPNMLPKELYDLQVEQGGYGAGTTASKCACWEWSSPIING